MADLGDVDSEAFAAEAHRFVDWIAEYLRNAERLPVLSKARPGDVRAALPASPPEAPEPLDTLLTEFERALLPGITHWNHPGFFAYFANSSTGPAILGELLASALNSNAMLWKTSPAATELEHRGPRLAPTDAGAEGGALRGHPRHRVGVHSARLWPLPARPWRASTRAVAALVGQARLRMYASEHAHSSVEKAGIVLGVGQDGFRAIPADARFRMDPAALAQAVAEDRAAGFTPFAVTATVGTTSTTSIDPVPAIADICAREGLWLHVDAAYAGSAAVAPELRFVLDGVERADSLVVNPHKWLFVPLDLSVLYTRRPDVLKRAFSLVPEYLRTPEEDLAPNLMDYGVSLGRRFRALKLWMVIRAFGRRGLAARIRDHVRLAALFRSWIEADEGFEVAAPSPLSVVCFRARFPGRPADEADRGNDALMAAVNATGEAYLSHTRLGGRTTLRLAVGNVRTEERHVRRAYELLHEEVRRLRS